MDFCTYSSSFLDNRAYAYCSRDSALLIDTIHDNCLFDDLHKRNIKDIRVLLTHEHFDHLLGLERLRQEFKCHVICEEKTAKNILDPCKNLSAYAEYLRELFSEKSQKVCVDGLEKSFSCVVDEVFVSNYKLEFGDLCFDLISTPGHSEGSICVLQNYNSKLEKIFTGDTVLFDYPIYTKIPGGSKKAFQEKTKSFLLSLPGDVVFYPGHGQSRIMRDARNIILAK